MTDSTIKQLAIAPTSSSDWLSSLARKQIFAQLEALQYGRLTIEDDDGVYSFGDTSATPVLCARIKVVDLAFYRDVLQGGAIGGAEAYVRGHWTTPDLLTVTRVMSANIDVLHAMDGRRSLWQRMGLRLFHLMNRNSRDGSRDNIRAHYDLGNDFFALFLDPTMMYSSAIYPEPEASLEQASLYKLQRVCEQLQLREEDHLLEIGTGWGGMAIYAAKHYGCRVTTTTISQQQYDYAQQRVAQENLQDKVTVLLRDYRELEGSYDKLVSIEMIEAVGPQYYETFFRRCSELLKPEGLMLIQAILMPDQRYERAQRSVDFIQRYIFPGGSLPSQGVINQHVGESTDMQIISVTDITAHYALTLRDWRERFEQCRQQVAEQGFDESFQRLWEYYLCYCEGGFAERIIGTSQLLMAGPQYRDPLLQH